MSQTPVSCLIDAGTTVRGTIQGTGLVEVGGRLEGRAELDDRLHVRPGGHVDAHVQAGEITVEGTLEGDATARGHLEVLAGARLASTVNATTLRLAGNASAHCTVNMVLDLPRELS